MGDRYQAVIGGNGIELIENTSACSYTTLIESGSASLRDWQKIAELLNGRPLSGQLCISKEEGELLDFVKSVLAAQIESCKSSPGSPPECNRLARSINAISRATATLSTKPEADRG